MVVMIKLRRGWIKMICLILLGGCAVLVTVLVVAAAMLSSRISRDEDQ